MRFDQVNISSQHWARRNRWRRIKQRFRRPTSGHTKLQCAIHSRSLAAVPSHYHRLRKRKMTHSHDSRLTLDGGREGPAAAAVSPWAEGGRCYLRSSTPTNGANTHSPVRPRPSLPEGGGGDVTEEKRNLMIEYSWQREWGRCLSVYLVMCLLLVLWVCNLELGRKRLLFAATRASRTGAAPRMNLETLSRPTLWQTVNMNSIKPANPNKTAAEHRDPTMNPATAKKGACVSFFESQDNSDSLRKQALTMTRTWTKMACVVFSCESELLEQVEKNIYKLNSNNFSTEYTHFQSIRCSQ